MNGWLKLHRSLLDKVIWSAGTPEQCKILITLLMLANHEERQWMWKGEKYTCKPGQFITSGVSLVEKCGNGITRQNVRTALAKFEKMGFLTKESTNTSTLITIVNWEKYQGYEPETNQVINQDLTNCQPSANQPLTTNKNKKNNKNYKEGKKNMYIVGQETLSFSEVCKGIVDYLNIKAGTNYKATTKKTRDLIQARLNEDFTVEDFKTVIDKKVEQWKNDSKMVPFLRPETLFSNKFEGYLNQKQGITQFDEFMRIAREGL